MGLVSNSGVILVIFKEFIVNSSSNIRMIFSGLLGCKPIFAKPKYGQSSIDLAPNWYGAKILAILSKTLIRQHFFSLVGSKPNINFHCPAKTLACLILVYPYFGLP